MVEADTVSLKGTNGHKIRVTDHNGVVTVSGLDSTVTISNFEEGTDHLLINGQTVTVANGRTVTVAAVNGKDSDGTSTASDDSHAAALLGQFMASSFARRAIVTVRHQLPINHRPSSRCWRSRMLEATSSPGERK